MAVDLISGAPRLENLETRQDLARCIQANFRGSVQRSLYRGWKWPDGSGPMEVSPWQTGRFQVFLSSDFYRLKDC